MFPEEAVKQLKSFTDAVKNNPNLLHTPQLLFFKHFIESFGGKVPTYEEHSIPKTRVEPEESSSSSKVEEEIGEGEEIVESDVELDNTGVIDNPDEVTDEVPLPDVGLEVSEEDAEKASEKRAEAISAFNESSYENAAKLYTEAIGFNPGLALMYAKRGQCYLKLNKPNACIRDCTIALSLNPDNAAAYKFRGRAHRLLGNWLEAARDLRSASKIDLDEQTDEWLKEVTPNARKLEEHNLKYERIRREKEIKEKQEKIRKAREEHAKAAASSAETKPQSDTGTDPTDADGSDFSQYANIFNDPELMKLFEDPEVTAAFQDFSKNPSNIAKYAGNPKVMQVVNKLATKFRGGEGLPGFGGGGFPGFGGGAPGGAPGAGGFPFGGAGFP